MYEEIYQIAAAIARPSEAERPLLEALCAAAEADAAARLREGVTPEECGSSFLCAAAMLAAAGALSCQSSGGVEQFTAGDVQLRLKSGGGDSDTAEPLRRRAGELMRPWWRDEDFAFTGVRG